MDTPIAKPSRPLSFRENFVEIYLRERTFLAVVLGALVLAALVTPMPEVARWFAFVIAGYAVVGNDSIQTIGTFLAANAKRPWWVLWLWIAGLLLVTVTASWLIYDGDVSWQRLAGKGFRTAPTSFHYLQVVAPIFLLVMTRMRMPVSTTFLLLSTFATDGKAINSVLQKSLMGYGVALVVAFAAWTWLVPALSKNWKNQPAHDVWVPLQWFTTGTLWVFWLMQDAANVAIFLPRSLSPVELAAFLTVLCGGLAIMIYLRGDRIQQIVDEKTDIVDVRAATMVDFVYALIVGFFTFYATTVPMSTTWVFIGLLGGRELAMALRRQSDQTWRGALTMMGRDLALTVAGLIVSLIVACSSNPVMRDTLLKALGMTST